MSWVSPTRYFTGKVSDEDLPGLYARAWAVIPSVKLEGFGLVTLESLAGGTPVVASAVGGPGEFLSARFPELFPPSDVPALADGLARAAAGDGQLTNEECMAFAAEFSWNQTAQRLLTIYQKRQGAAA